MEAKVNEELTMLGTDPQFENDAYYWYSKNLYTEQRHFEEKDE